MNRVRTIFSHGKYMKVVSADTTPPMCTPRGKKDGFALAPLGWTADTAKALNAPDIIW